MKYFDRTRNFEIKAGFDIFFFVFAYVLLQQGPARLELMWFHVICVVLFTLHVQFIRFIQIFDFFFNTNPPICLYVLKTIEINAQSIARKLDIYFYALRTPAFTDSSKIMELHQHFWKDISKQGYPYFAYG